MKNLFAGQRVRILWSTAWPELAGKEGRILARDTDGGIDGTSEWRVAPDIWGSELAPREGTSGGQRFAPSSEQLEPILPEGAAPGNWEEIETLLPNIREATKA